MTIAAIEMITDAYRTANVIDENETPSAEQGVVGLRVLNQMMGQWDRDGIKLGWQVVDEQADTLPLQFQDERCVKFNLAVELSGEFGIEALPRVQKIANDTYDALAKAHRLQVECKLDHLPAEDASYFRGSIETGG
jgi:hypothetical protein